jgi:hypothetical protein
MEADAVENKPSWRPRLSRQILCFQRLRLRPIGEMRRCHPKPRNPMRPQACNAIYRASGKPDTETLEALEIFGSLFGSLFVLQC